ncbi:hypothetical protein L0P92_09540 [Streptomyces muensis]|uniref:Uncharacterized protein n=1 Tax=Streptomyces muensis TaxID=1077944 RepID=A0A9X1PWE3_STRM4|nr:hypothetical protein [Streptomyces muensis]MCF1593809.1 hypothetical protein [Streptomyces muensis]
MRKEQPYLGAQLRFTDTDGLRLTCLATTTTGEDRIRTARATGLRVSPRRYLRLTRHRP